MKILAVVDSVLIGETLECLLRRNRFTINDAAMSLAKILSLNDFELEWSNCGNAALASVSNAPPDALLVDLSMKGFDPVEFVRKVRRCIPSLPVLAIIARDVITQPAQCRQLGIEDCIRRPFEMQDVITRLQGLQRRYGLKPRSEIAIGSVVLNTDSHTLLIDGNEYCLSRREYLLLKNLMSSPGKVHSRHSLESKLYRWDEELASNAIDVHVHNLRKKLPAGFIRTVRGIGYSVSEADSHSLSTLYPKHSETCN